MRNRPSASWGANLLSRSYLDKDPAPGMGRLARATDPLHGGDILKLTFAGRRNFEQWARGDSARDSRRAHEDAVIRAWASSGRAIHHVSGYCIACGGDRSFVLDAGYTGLTAGVATPNEGAIHMARALVRATGSAKLMRAAKYVARRALAPRLPPIDRLPDWQPNWREQLVCTTCGMNCRTRASIANLAEFMPEREPIWLAEQTTRLFAYLSREYPRLIGSEYVGSHAISGAIGAGGIRHEDCTETSFPDRSLAAVLSFDVLEHVPRFEQAIGEAHRILRPGGVFFWSAPFLIDGDVTLRRSIVLEDGRIQHLLPPEYHGDPVHPSTGILCYQHFSWDVLELMRAAGFKDAVLRLYWNASEAVVGPEQVFLVGRA